MYVITETMTTTMECDMTFATWILEVDSILLDRMMTTFDAYSDYDFERAFYTLDKTPLEAAIEAVFDVDLLEVLGV